MVIFSSQSIGSRTVFQDVGPKADIHSVWLKANWFSSLLIIKQVYFICLVIQLPSNTLSCLLMNAAVEGKRSLHFLGLYTLFDHRTEVR